MVTFADICDWPEGEPSIRWTDRVIWRELSDKWRSPEGSSHRTLRSSRRDPPGRNQIHSPATSRHCKTTVRKIRRCSPGWGWTTRTMCLHHKTARSWQEQNEEEGRKQLWSSFEANVLLYSPLDVAQIFSAVNSCALCDFLVPSSWQNVGVMWCLPRAFVPFTVLVDKTTANSGAPTFVVGRIVELIGSLVETIWFAVWVWHCLVGGGNLAFSFRGWGISLFWHSLFPSTWPKNKCLRWVRWITVDEFRSLWTSFVRDFHDCSARIRNLKVQWAFVCSINYWPPCSCVCHWMTDVNTRLRASLQSTAIILCVLSCLCTKFVAKFISTNVFFLVWQRNAHLTNPKLFVQFEVHLCNCYLLK